MAQFDDVLAIYLSLKRDLGDRDGDGYGGGVPENFLSDSGIIVAGLFLMLFAQFEAEVNHRCEVLIRHHKGLPDWRDRRAWDAFDDKRVNDIPFRRRLALVVEKGQAIYANVGNLYLERNELAHGEKSALDVDMKKAIETLTAALAAMDISP